MVTKSRIWITNQQKSYFPSPGFRNASLKILLATDCTVLYYIICMKITKEEEEWCCRIWSGGNPFTSRRAEPKVPLDLPQSFCITTLPEVSWHFPRMTARRKGMWMHKPMTDLGSVLQTPCRSIARCMCYYESMLYCWCSCMHNCSIPQWSFLIVVVIDQI
jgi:hypothetical protein